MRSRREDATSHAGRHRAPVWNQEFQFLVEDPMNQVQTLTYFSHTALCSLAYNGVLFVCYGVALGTVPCSSA